MGRGRDALRLAEQALAEEPEWAWAHAVRAEALLHLGELDAASEAAGRAIGIAPANAWGYRVRALVLLRTGSRSECLKMAATACELEPESPPSLHIRVQAELLNGRRAEARAAASRLVELAPEEPFAHEAVGLVALHERQWDEAAQHFLRALSLDPEHFTSLNNLALCLERRRKFTEAMEALHRAARLAPEDRLVRFNLRRVMSLWAARQARFYLPLGVFWMIYQVVTRGMRQLHTAPSMIETIDHIWLAAMGGAMAMTIITLLRARRRLHPELRAFDKSEDRKAWPDLCIAGGATLLLCGGLMIADDQLRIWGHGDLTYVVCAAVFGGLAWHTVRTFRRSARAGVPKWPRYATILMLGPLLMAWSKLTEPEPKEALLSRGLLILLVPALASLVVGAIWKRRRRR